MHGALENIALAQPLPDGGCVCIYRSPGWRERQHAKYERCISDELRSAVPSLVGHSLGSFYGLFKAVVQTKQSFLYFHHDKLQDQARGWGRLKCTASSNERLLLCCENSAADFGASIPWPLWNPTSDRKLNHMVIPLHIQGRGMFQEWG